jgi:hypothetical protein
MTTYKPALIGTFLISLALTTAGVGCGTDSNDGASVTSVTHSADGSTLVKTVWMTSDELAALDSQREALAGLAANGVAASLDTTCAGASMWVYDDFWWVGNRICFAGPGDDFLASYAAPGGGDWSTQNKSFWAGSRSGSFTYTTGSRFVFAAWDKSNGPGSGHNKLHQD